MKHLKPFNENSGSNIEKLTLFKEVFEVLGYEITNYATESFTAEMDGDRFYCYCDEDYTGKYVMIEYGDKNGIELGNVTELLNYISKFSHKIIWESDMWLKLIKANPKFTFECPSEILLKIDSKFKNVAKIGVFESAIEPYKKTFDCGDVVKATNFVKKVMYLAEQRDHHPSIFVNRFIVTIEVITHSENRVTDKDLDLMQDIEKIYNEL